MSNISASAFSDTKAHYDLLDGLRGVAQGKRIILFP